MKMPVVHQQRREMPEKQSKNIVPNVATHKISSLISSSGVMEGRFAFGESIHVKGQIMGEVVVNGEGMLFSLAEGAQMKGSLAADQVLIAGNFEGTIRGGFVNIASTGVVTGEIIYDRLLISEGASINCSRIVNKKDAEKPINTDVEQKSAFNSNVRTADVHSIGAARAVG